MKINRLPLFALGPLLLAVLLTAGGCDRRIDVDFNFALEQSDYDWAEQLLESGADVNRRYRLVKGQTNLMLLAREEWNPRGLEFLIAHGAEPNMQSNNGRTALYVASANGRDRHVEILLASGADPTISTDWGESPLDAATDKGYASVERILLANGATR